MGNLIKKIKKRERIKKIIVCGDSGVGKTTLNHRYVEGKFSADTKMTIGVEFFSKEVEIKGRTLKLSIWDLMGLERCRFLCSDFCKGADGALLMFDLTRPTTLESIEEWVNICRKEDPNLPILFVGSKLDLKEDIMVDDGYALPYKERSDLFDYIKTSSKTGKNVEKTFEILINFILNRKKYERERKAIEIKLKKRLITIEQLIQEKRFSEATMEFIDIRSTAKKYNVCEIFEWNFFPMIDYLIIEKKFSVAESELEDIIEWAKQKLDICKKLKKEEVKRNKIETIKRTVLDYGIKISRLQIEEISEKTGIKDEYLITDVIMDMIGNKEIYAEYFRSTKSLVFDQKTNINEIDSLVEKFKEWEKESKVKRNKD